MNHASCLPALALAVMLACTSCGGGPEWGLVDDDWLGDMSDTSYSGAGDKARPNAREELVRLDEFEGDFVWADYAAPWCGPCKQQVRDMKKLEARYGDEIYFLTIMTSRSPEYGQGATVQTARSWASRHGLDPEYVLAADLWSKSIPEHRLYSPEGHTLLVYKGYLPADLAGELLEERMADWERWDEDGDRARWMQ